MRFLQTPEDKTVSMSPRIAAHLNKIGVNFDLVSHAHSRNSMQSARMAKLPPSQIAKAVILHDGDRYRMCVIPANHRLILERVNAHMHGNYRLATEREVAMLFDDCEIGAVPALGQVYGMPVSSARGIYGTDEWAGSFAYELPTRRSLRIYSSLTHIDALATAIPSGAVLWSRTVAMPPTKTAFIKPFENNYTMV